MILAVDVGNTNIVLGSIEDGEILNIVRIHTMLHETETEYAIKLLDVLKLCGIDPHGYDGAIISSVVPPVTAVLAAAIERVTGLKCIIVGPDTRTDMTVLLDDPGTLAPDIIVGSVAAMESCGAPAIVLDMGTATTIVVIDRDGNYRGGAIIPGVKLSFEALASGTSLLPDIAILSPEKSIGTNTVDALRSGAVFGSAATIDGMIDRFEAELGYPCSVVATGGLAQAITPYCRHKIVCDGDLLLKGLWILYQKNK